MLFSQCRIKKTWYGVIILIGLDVNRAIKSVKVYPYIYFSKQNPGNFTKDIQGEISSKVQLFLQDALLLSRTHSKNNRAKVQLAKQKYKLSKKWLKVEWHY